MEQGCQFPAPGAGDLIGGAVGSDILLLQTGEGLVQTGIEVYSPYVIFPGKIS